MEMPDDALLECMRLRRAFLDRKSEEFGNSRSKPKYKLLTQKTALSELGIFIFHILTTTKGSYIKEKTIDIYISDWEYREGVHLSEPCSKLCSQKIDVMNREKLLSKIKDSDNGFPHKGTLSQIKFDEVVSFIKTDFESVDSRTDFVVRDIIISIFDKKEIAKDVLTKFGL